VPHQKREELAARYPVHVTLKLARGLPSLRKRQPYRVLLEAFAAMRAKEGFRLVHYSVQSNHVHVVCEARDRGELSRAIQSLAIRIAKRLNSLWRRAGKLFADRFHQRILRTPREFRNALAYVLHNAAKHGALEAADAVDPFSSGRWFDGWRRRIDNAPSPPSPLAAAKTWLLSVGWMRWGRIEISASRPSSIAR
jgi:REP element-mobilizing transposase RayT